MYGDIVADSRLLDKLYLNAEDSINVDKQKLILQTELSRDFFPGLSKKNTRLIAVIYIINTDSSAISKKIEVQTLYIIHNDQIWISNPYDEENEFMPAYKLFRISKDGPEWETNIYVDVILAVKNSDTAKIHYLIAYHQLIMKLG